MIIPLEGSRVLLPVLIALEKRREGEGRQTLFSFISCSGLLFFSDTGTFSMLSSVVSLPSITLSGI